MEKDLHKRLEEAAENYIECNYKDSIAPDWNEKDFIAGAEWMFKEAIAQAKEWLEKENATLSTCFRFENDMSKLLEDKK